MATLAHGHVCEVFTQFGEKGVSSEQVAQALAAEVRAYAMSKAALGPHLADQWALPLALAVWRRPRSAAYTCTELTEHARTNFDMIERFLPVVFRTEASDEAWRVSVAAR
jgi:RNA 3'-terminal phosphate cyclase (ATP)